MTIPVIAAKVGDYFFVCMFPVIILGAMLNRYVMYVNGGLMPVKQYPDIAQRILQTSGYRPMNEATRHAWLCDRIRLGNGKWLKIVSIGDLLVFLGLTIGWLYIPVLIIRISNGSL